MHICQDCRWIGEFPDSFSTEEKRLNALLSLNPGDPVPSGECPACGGKTLPEDLKELGIPEGIEHNTQPLFSGERWNLQVMQGSTSLTLYIRDRISGSMTEIDVDSIYERVRLEITSFADDVELDDAESQIMLSIGKGNIATYPTGESLSAPIIYMNDGARLGTLMNLEQFKAQANAGPTLT